MKSGFSSRIALAGLLACALWLGGCDRTDETGSFPAASQSDCLPNLTLTDQHGRGVNLASLKGKFVLIDFIYTRCGDTCPLLTSKMVETEKKFSPELAKKVRIVSVTLDPEHDHPAELLKYADQHGAENSGWLFLSGTPAQIDAYLAIFKIKRYREADGSIDHVTTSFLLGPDGRQVRQYDGIAVKPATMVRDAADAISHG